MKPRKHSLATPVPPKPTAIPPASTPVPPTPEPAPVVAAPQAAAIAEPHGLRPDAPPYAVHGPYAVGTREFTIETAGRTTPVTVWYPARNPAGEPEEITYSMDIGDAGMKPFPVRGNALLDAQPDTTGAPYPLVVYSHGLFLYRQTAAYLAEHLASQGFVVIAGNHEDNWGTFGQPWDKSYVSRPADITAWIDFAEKLNAQGGDLAGLIDSDHVGVTGHSFGGYTALAAGGARFDHNWFLDVLCPAGPLAPDDILNECGWLRDKLPGMAAQAGLDAVPEGLWPNWGDPRVDAIAITAPATRSGPAGNAAVTVPTLLLVGSADSIINVKLNVNDTYNNLGSPHKTLVMLENGGHALFINDCVAATGMADVAFIYCSDPIWDMDRAHDLHNHFTTAFLLAELKGDAEAAKALAPENVVFPGIKYETTGYGAAPTAK